MGGGNSGSAGMPAADSGLSPRGRGKPQEIGGGEGLLRSIPAWAGETRTGRITGHYTPVYPRVGGGNVAPAIDRTPLTGLSPRGRGKLVAVRPLILFGRSIPAWAGETAYSGCSRQTGRVYPRVGGGNGITAVLLNGGQGLSPRGRGKPKGKRNPPVCGGSIPAWAGETPPGRQRSPPASVYPRVGGGNATPFPPAEEHTGLSPRGRGKRGYHLHLPRHRRSIPAWAGETGAPELMTNSSRVYPRVGGGNAI